MADPSDVQLQTYGANTALNLAGNSSGADNDNDHFGMEDNGGFKESLYHVTEDVQQTILHPRDALKAALKKEEPININSRRRTVFLMLNTMIGSGILNQPQVFSESGIFGALIIFGFCGYFTWLGAIVIVDVGLRTKSKSFQELMEKKHGIPGKIFLDVMIVLGNIGALMSYLTVIGGTLSRLISSWGAEGEGSNIYMITTLVTTFCILPLCLNRYFGHLGTISYISIGAIVLVLAVVIIAGPIFGNGGKINLLNGMGMFEKMGSIVFALSCNVASFHAYSGTKDVSLPLWEDIMVSEELLCSSPPLPFYFLLFPTRR